MEGAVESSYRPSVRVTELLLRFPAALRLFKKLKTKQRVATQLEQERTSALLSSIRQCSALSRSRMYCCTSKLQSHAPEASSRVPSSMAVSSISMLPLFFKSPKSLAAPRVKRTPSLSTSFHSPKMCRPEASLSRKKNVH